MGFIKLKVSPSVEISFLVPEEKSESIKEAMTTLLQHCTADEIALLSKGAENPTIKKLALQYLQISL